MAQEWIKKYLRIKPEVEKIFDDLDNYKKFCQDYGYVYDERHLYNERSPYGEYNKMLKGKEPWDQWRSPPRKREHNRNRHETST